MVDNNQNADYVLKYIIVGDAAVGKSNICYRFIKGKFKEQYQATLGMDFAYKNLKVGNNNYRIQIWDTAGQECFQSISRGYYKSSVCGLIVYDITDRNSFNNIANWVEQCKNNGPSTLSLILVGNKTDLEEKRDITYEEGLNIAERFNMKFYETSAFNGNNINNLFTESLENIIKKIDNGDYDLTTSDCGITANSIRISDIYKENNSKNKNKKKKRFC